MTLTQFIGLSCIAIPVGWSIYESFRMRQHRKSTEYILHLITVNLEKMMKRQDDASKIDATTVRTLAAIECRLSRPVNPTDGVRH